MYYKTLQTTPDTIEELASDLLKRRLAASKMDALRLAKGMLDKSQSKQGSQRIIGYSGPGTFEQVQQSTQESGKQQETPKQVHIVHTTNQENNSDLSQLHEVIASLQTQIASQSQQMEQMQEHVQTLHSAFQEHKQTHEPHVQKIADLQEQVASLHQNHSHLQQAIDGLSKVKENINAHVLETPSTPQEDFTKQEVEQPAPVQEEYRQEQSDFTVEQNIASEIAQVETHTTHDIEEHQIEQQEIDFIQPRDEQAIDFGPEPVEQPQTQQFNGFIEKPVQQETAQHQPQTVQEPAIPTEQKEESKIDLMNIFDSSRR